MPEEPTREQHSFDELAKGLANRSLSRHDALKWVGAAIVGGLLASVPGVAWAKKPQSPPPPPPPPPASPPPPPPQSPPPPPPASPPPPPPEGQCPPGERSDPNCGCIPSDHTCCTLGSVCTPDEVCCNGYGRIQRDWVCCPTGYACPPGKRCTTDGSSGSDPAYPGCEAA
jgi:hypothetical protein